MNTSTSPNDDLAEFFLGLDSKKLRKWEVTFHFYPKKSSDRKDISGRIRSVSRCDADDNQCVVVETDNFSLKVISDSVCVILGTGDHFYGGTVTVKRKWRFLPLPSMPVPMLPMPV